MARMVALSIEERAVIGSLLVTAIEERGSAGREDFERSVEFVVARALHFFARLHGGPKDGEELRMPLEFEAYIGLPVLDEPISQETIDAHELDGRPLDVRVTRHGYRRREGSPEPLAGEVADFDYVGVD